MTTPNSTTERGVTDAEVTSFRCAMSWRASELPDDQIRHALEAFAKSRQPSAQGGEKVEPPIERVMGEACSNCHGSGVGMDGKACPFAPHKQVTYKLRATPPATSGMKEKFEFPTNWDSVPAPHTSQSYAPEVIKWHSLNNPCYACEGPCRLRKPAIEALAAIRAGKKG